VSFETDRRLRMGEFGIQPRLVKPPEAEREEASQGDLGATMVYSATRAQRVAEPPAQPTTRALLTMDGKTFVLDQPRAVVGRSRRSDFVVEDPNMSRRHFELQRRGDDWYVVDLESTNGIAVNGRRVPSAQLQAGDEIVAGTSRMRFNLD
jgi:pSer/pThr/pTyr-binding forkhead associated (FHA) protein